MDISEQLDERYKWRIQFPKCLFIGADWLIELSFSLKRASIFAEGFSNYECEWEKYRRGEREPRFRFLMFTQYMIDTTKRES